MVDSNWLTKTRHIRHAASLRGLAFDLDVEFLLALFNSTDGKCVYTGESMTLGAGRNPMSLSVDRFDPGLGYTKHNVILCTSRSNAIKQNQTPRELAIWMPMWYARAIRHLEARNAYIS